MKNILLRFGILIIIVVLPIVRRFTFNYEYSKNVDSWKRIVIMTTEGPGNYDEMSRALLTVG